MAKFYVWGSKKFLTNVYFKNWVNESCSLYIDFAFYYQHYIFAPQVVIDACKKYLPFTGKGFDSPKLTVYLGDGAEYMKIHKGEFDVIISDSPDPKGEITVFFFFFYINPMYHRVSHGATKQRTSPYTG